MSGPGASTVEEAFAGVPSPSALLADADLADLGGVETEELRRLRVACESAEEGISYSRRILQGRLDILRAALAGRDDPAAGAILEALPNILADQGHATDPAQVRSTRVRVPPDADRYTAVIDAVLSEDVLEAVDHHLEDLTGAIEVLSEVEHEFSVRRRALFDRIDAIRAELLTRYKDGRADVRELLA